MFSKLAIILGILHISAASSSNNEKRNKKVLSLFQVVSFPNDPCPATPRNGTCYTSDECSQKGGTSGGSCANGFGVCCIIQLRCGQSASDNTTYLTNTAPLQSSTCSYKVCPSNANICRIRYDFMAFNLAQPTNVQPVATVAPIKNAPAVSNGNCVTDTFSISAPGTVGSPIICGDNTNYHMILDANSECHTVTFNIGAAGNAQRTWDIAVRQYGCGAEDISGPPGCLQFYTGNTGVIQNFNFQPGATKVGSNFPHLANQYYDICFRREVAKNVICYSVAIGVVGGGGAALANQDSFGLSSVKSVVVAGVAIAVATSGTDDACSSDYIEIPNGELKAAALASVMNFRAPLVPILFNAATTATKFCGRFLSNAVGAAANVSICTKVAPFKLRVNFDEVEVTSLGVVNAGAGGAGITPAEAAVLEDQLFPTGIVGFQLAFSQF